MASGTGSLSEKLSGSSAVAAKFSFERAQRSTIRDSFDRIGKGQVKCRHCSKLFAHSSSTSSMREHLRHIHPSAVNTDSEKKPSIQSFFPTVAQTNSKPVSAASAAAITERLVDWGTADLRPLSIVCDDGFLALMAHVSPGYSVPSRTHIASKVKDRHAAGKKELAHLMSEEAKFCSLTTDAWSSKATQSFNTLACHFVNREWALVSCVLDTSLFSGSHTAERIAEKVNAALNPFCEPANVVAIIHDQAANAVAAGATLCKEHGWQSILCSAHLLQTAARHAIDNCRPVQKLLASGRRLVGHFKHSNQATEMLLSRQKQLGESPLKLVQDVPTRWNSSFYMLERLLKLKLALHAVFQNDVHKKFRDLIMDDRQWKLAEEFVDVMRPQETATSILGGQKYVTASLVLPVIVSVRDGLAAAGESFSGAVAGFRRHLADELTGKFCLDKQDAASTWVLAAAMDPRFRGLSFLPSLSIRAVDVKQCVVAAAVAADDGINSEGRSQEPAAKRKPSTIVVITVWLTDKMKVNRQAKKCNRFSPSTINRRECTHCAPFGQCEWGPDATSEGFVPICLRLHRRPIGASDRLM